MKLVEVDLRRRCHVVHSLLLQICGSSGVRKKMFGLVNKLGAKAIMSVVLYDKPARAME